MRIRDPRPQRCVWIAYVVGSDGETYLMRALDSARWGAIGPAGFLLHGQEVVDRMHGSKSFGVDRYRQTWYCVPVGA